MMKSLKHYQAIDARIIALNWLLQEHKNNDIWMKHGNNEKVIADKD